MRREKANLFYLTKAHEAESVRKTVVAPVAPLDKLRAGLATDALITLITLITLIKGLKTKNN